MLRLLVTLAVGLRALNASAQGAPGLDLGGFLQTGGEAERYLRALQLVGVVPATPWTIRPLFALSVNASADSTRVSAHPWRTKWTADRDSSAWSWRILRPSARLLYNSTFAAPTYDGPTWAGRGVTGELQGGVTLARGRFHLQLAPLVFLAQNQEFALAPNGLTGVGAYRDARFPDKIDAPQRFGDRSYGRIDAGNSLAYFASSKLLTGVSTAGESWGPAREYPLVLSGASGGFPHVFVGTNSPVNAWLFSVHARLIIGTISQSAFSSIDSSPKNRWASALVLTIIPRGIPGLELGATRFVEAAQHGALPDFGTASRVFSSLDVNKYENVEAENQLASAFFRWAFPGAGFELYGEYGKEDYSLEIRRLLQYPDDLRSFVVGFQRAMLVNANRMRTIRFELVNAELSASNRGERGDVAERKLHVPFPPYLHGIVQQGHTNHGLFLGSADAYGGAGWRAGVDQFTVRGRSSLSLEHSLRFDWLPNTRETSDATHPDVIWAIGAERMRFAGRRDYTLSLTAMFDMNRNLVDGHNVFNLRSAVRVRGW